MTTFLFVGERPSHKAVEIGATWQNGRLAAKQLHDALRMIGIDPDKHQYINLWTRPDAGEDDFADEVVALKKIRRAWHAGLVIVGMGAIVSRVLTKKNIPHLQLIHPAARGKIRKKERYTAHVGAVLSARQGAGG